MVSPERESGEDEVSRIGSKTVYHLHLDREDIRGAKYVLLPGDPARVEMIARTLPLENAVELAWKREYRTWLGYMGGVPVLVTSTGIGGPSTSIAVDELARLGVTTFLRVGTSGAIQPGVDAGDVVITTGAVRLDGASIDYAPVEYPAAAHHEVVRALVEAAETLGLPYHVGITCSTATFYPGQERRDSYTGYVPRRFQGITEEWRSLNVINYEMEASALLTLCGVMGLRGGCVTGIVSRRAEEETVTPQSLKRGEENAVLAATKAMEIIISTDRGRG